MTRVGVVVVTHNSAAHIGACLDSLTTASAGLELAAIVIDNDSRDGTPEVVRSTRPDVEVVTLTTNVGFARAVNVAASRLEDCSHLLLLNPDATMTSGSLKALMAALERSPRSAACGPHLRYPDGRHQISARPLPTLESTIYDALLLYHLKPRPDLVEQFPADSSTTEVDCLSGACLLIQKDCFDALGGMDERFFLYGEDIDLCARISAAGRTLLLVAEVDVAHVEGASAFQDRAAFFREIHRARALYARKHLGPLKGPLAVAAQLAGLAIRGLVYPFGRVFGRPDLTSHARHQWSAILAVGTPPAR